MISNSTGRVLASWSMFIAQGTSTLANASQRFHSGRWAFVAFICMRLANASLSQVPSHHAIVTRFPNHWCATSCAITSNEVRSSLWLALARSITRYGAR